MTLTHLTIDQDAIHIKLSHSGTVWPIVYLLMGLKLLLPLIFIGIEAYKQRKAPIGFHSAMILIVGTVAMSFYIARRNRHNANQKKRASYQPIDRNSSFKPLNQRLVA